MPTVVRFEHNPKGIGQLLRSQGVRDHLGVRAERMGDYVRAGTDLPVLVEDRTGSRARWRVIIDHPGAKALEAKKRLLGRSVDAAR